jgi:ABC-type transport system substrate-binding protein
VKLADRYEIVRELGRGGMGIVHLARDPMLDRDVAIKLIGQISDERKQRFLREARVVAKMDHPGIVGVYDLGEHEDGLFFVMPYVPGVNLRQVLGESPLKLRQLVELGIQAAEALEYSHGLGIVHRDVKPENIMVTSHTADALRIRLTDFGLAVHATEQRLTTTGALVGTVSYLSPEQVVGNAVDPRVDIYALGTVLYECIAGRTPFKGEMQSVLFRIVHEEPQPLGQLVQDLDAELEQLVHSCLAKDPALRLQRAGDLAAALARYRAKLGDSARGGEALRTVEMRRGFAAVPPPAAPFVGRAKELAELQNRLNLAIGGECQVLIVEGDAGVGKTRLVEELERLAHARHIRVLTGNFNEQDGATPYQGFCEMLETHLRRASASGTELLEVEDELVALFPSLGELRPGRTRPLRPQPAPSDSDRVAVFDVLARSLTRIAGDEPLLLVLEDLHLATPSVEALQYITRRLGATKTLVLGTYTPAEVDRAHPITKLLDGFKGNKRFSIVHLHPFTPDEHRSFVATVALGATIDDSVSQRLYDISEGNPFFTRELFRSLIDTGTISRDGQGSYQLAGGAALSFEAIPSTIQKAVERRLERLPDELRQVLAFASVLGKSFEEHELEAIVDDEVELDDALDKLVRGGFIEEQRKGRGDRLELTSGTMREVLYAELPRRKRRGLHRRVAEHLESKHAGKLERVRAQLVHHYEQADDAAKVIEHGLALASAALAAHSTEDAIRASRAVLGFVEEAENASVEAEARRLLASAHRAAGDFEAALKELEAAIKVHEKVGDHAMAVAAYAEAAFAAWHGRRVAEAKRWIDKGLAGAREAGDHALLAKLWPLAITNANLSADAATARELLEESERARKAESSEPAAASGGTVRVALASRAAATEPARAFVSDEAELLSNVFETLLATDEHGNVVPGLAEVWQSRDGGARFDFVLRPGLCWHDGSPVTAAHVKASLERAAQLAPDRLVPALSPIRGTRARLAGQADAIEGIEVRGERELSIALDEPLPIFPALLTDFRTAIVKPRDGEVPLGTGPFKIASVATDKIALARVERPGRTTALVDALEYHVAGSAAERVDGFRAGRFEIVGELPPQEIDALLRDRRLGARSLEWPKKNACFVLFHRGSERVRDPAIRAALCRSIAVSDLVWRHLGRLARPADGLVPPGVLGHDAGRRHAVLPREKALEQLAGAGVTPAAPLRLRAAVTPALIGRPAIAALFEAWAGLGVAIEVVTPDMDTYLAKIREPDGIDLAIQRWGADYDDPDSFSYALFDSQVGTRRALWSDPALDRALHEARLEPAPARRVSMYRAIEDSLLAVNAILPLWHDEDIRICSGRLRELRRVPSAPFIDYTAVRVSAAEGERPASAGAITMLLSRRLTTLDPHRADTSQELLIMNAIYETLLRETHGARIVPWLAESMTIENDGKRYRFMLRAGVRFHDGRTLTARDVRYSLERVLVKGTPVYAEQLSAIVGARAMIERKTSELSGLRIHSPRELTIDLETSMPSLPAILTFSASAIVPEGSEPAGKSYREGAVGTGAFRIVRSERLERVELEANPFYWRAGYPRAAGLTFEAERPAAEAIARLSNTPGLVLWDLAPADAERVWNDRAVDAQRLAALALSTDTLVFNCRRPPFDDVDARRAVAGAIDVAALAKLLGHTVTPAHSLLPPGILGHDSGRRARRWPARRFDCDIVVGLSPLFSKGAEAVSLAIIATLGELGLRCRVERMMGTAAKDDRALDIFINGWTADYPDPNTFMHDLLHSSGGIYGRLLGTPELDVLVERIRRDPDAAGRQAACHDVEAMLADRALLVPLTYRRYVMLAHRSVRGLTEELPSSGSLDCAALSVED